MRERPDPTYLPPMPSKGDLIAHYAERLIKALEGIDGRLADVASELKGIKEALPQSIELSLFDDDDEQERTP